MAEIESIVKPFGVLDDIRWKSVSFVYIWIFHSALVAELQLTSQYPKSNCLLHLPIGFLQIANDVLRFRHPPIFSLFRDNAQYRYRSPFTRRHQVVMVVLLSGVAQLHINFQMFDRPKNQFAKWAPGRQIQRQLIRNW